MAQGLLGGLSKNSALSGSINDINAQIDATKLQSARDMRDLKREGASFLSRTRQFIANSGAAGTASEGALLSSAAGEFGRSGERLRQDRDIKVSSLKTARRNLKAAQGLNTFNSLAGLGVSVFASGAAPDTSVTDIPTTRPSVLRKETTSKPGGIGGF